MARIQTAWAEIDGLIFIVIVIASIIAQFIKAARKGRGQKTGVPENELPESSGSGGEAELLDFMRRLSRGESEEQFPSPSPPPPPPPPPPRPPKPAVKPAVTWRVKASTGGPGREATGAGAPRPFARVPPRVEEVQPVVATVQPSAPAPAVEQPVSEPSPAPVAPAVAAVPDAVFESRSVEQLRREIKAAASDPSSLQRAWMLREILGAPAALRPLGYQG